MRTISLLCLINPVLNQADESHFSIRPPVKSHFIEHVPQFRVPGGHGWIAIPSMSLRKTILFLILLLGNAMLVMHGSVQQI
jgi:hypothetical protein